MNVFLKLLFLLIIFGMPNFLSDKKIWLYQEDVFFNNLSDNIIFIKNLSNHQRGLELNWHSFVKSDLETWAANRELVLIYDQNMGLGLLDCATSIIEPISVLYAKYHPIDFLFKNCLSHAHNLEFAVDAQDIAHKELECYAKVNWLWQQETSRLYDRIYAKSPKLKTALLAEMKSWNEYITAEQKNLTKDQFLKKMFARKHARSLSFYIKNMDQWKLKMQSRESSSKINP